MLKQEHILNYINELLYLVTTSEQTIIYPSEEEKQIAFLNILKNKHHEDIIYNEATEKWYQYYKKEIIEHHQIYHLEYLIDITNIKEQEKKYQIDTLTNVLVRDTLLKNIKKELIECFKQKIPFSIIIGDIDYFKEVNDTYGHIAGDQVLKKIGNIFITHTTQTNEIVGRYGGEEFIFFLKDSTLNEAVKKIEIIQNELKNLNISYKKSNISNITMSFGIYHSNALKETQITENSIDNVLSELIHNADMALYTSKNSGRNQTHVFYDNGTIHKI